MDITAVKAAFARYAGNITRLLGGKVDKEEGKQLSTEDYTTDEKTKLTGVKSMAMRDIHVSTDQPDNAIGEDGDIWVTIRAPQQ